MGYAITRDRSYSSARAPQYLGRRDMQALREAAAHDAELGSWLSKATGIHIKIPTPKWKNVKSFAVALTKPHTWAENVINEGERLVKKTQQVRAAADKVSETAQRVEGAIIGAGAGAQAGYNQPVGVDRTWLIVGGAVVATALLSRR